MLPYIHLEVCILTMVDDSFILDVVSFTPSGILYRHACNIIPQWLYVHTRTKWKGKKQAYIVHVKYEQYTGNWKGCELKYDAIETFSKGSTFCEWYPPVLQWNTIIFITISREILAFWKCAKSYSCVAKFVWVCCQHFEFGWEAIRWKDNQFLVINSYPHDKRHSI